MRRVARGLVLLAALLVAAASAAALRDRGPREYHETLYVFGTLVEVVIYGESEADAQAASAELGREFGRLHHAWHAWRPGMLTSLNEAIAAGHSYSVDNELAGLLEQGQALSCASGGLFDPGIGALVGLWGFHADTPPVGPPPSRAEIDRIMDRHPGIADLRIEGRAVSSSNPAVRLDLGAYAKGAALDRAAALLKARGIDSAVLNAGGGVQVLGRHGDRPWRVAIRDPFEWGAVAAVSLAPGEVLHSSGNYERYLEHDGQRLSHILDPRTGYPVRDIVSASVLDRNGARADAAATALSVAGPGLWPVVARRMGIETALLIDASGQVFATPAMAARLEAVAGELPPIRIVELPENRASDDCVLPAAAS